MKAKIYLVLTVFLSYFNFTYAGSIILTGREAAAKFKNATMVIYEDRSPLPNTIEFDAKMPLPEDQFPTFMKQIFQDGNVTFKKIRTSTDKDGTVHTRYKQEINGIPVEYGDVTTHGKNGTISLITGEMYPADVNTKAKTLSENNALAKAKSFMGAQKYMWEIPGNEEFIKKEQENSKATFKPKGELVYVYQNNQPSKQLRLAYKFNVYAAEPLARKMIWVDAQTGTILYSQNIIRDANVVGTATTQYSGVQPITTDQTSSNSYRLYETGRAGGTKIHTWNLKKSQNYGSAVEFTDADNNWNNVNTNKDQYATDAHWGAEMVVDFYWQKLNRNSIDGAGMTVNGYVHYSTNYDNAFWDGTRMTYGDGNQLKPLVCLDVTGHEMSHGLVQHTANLGGSGSSEADALNESFADIFGNTIERFARPSQHSWWIGEDIMPAGYNGQGLRNMANPNTSNDAPQPDTYQGTYWDASGEPHTNDGVQNFWYYLLVTGGTGTNDNGDAYSVTGIGWDEAIQIVYKSLKDYLSSNATYSTARTASIQAATALYGACSPELIAVTNAWYAVGVGAQYSGGAVVSDFTASPQTGCSVPFNVTFTNTGTTGNGTTYNWDFGDGSTSTLENPTHTYTNYGQYTVTLTSTPSVGGCSSDVETKTNFIDVNSTNSCFSCDTINYPLPGTLTIYSSNNGGYVGGWNGYLDVAKANQFTNYGTYTHVTGAYIGFYGVKDGGNNTTIDINVWNDNAGTPGTVIGTIPISLSTLQSLLPLTNGEHQGVVKFTFPEPIAVTSPFYLGINMNNFQGQDSLGIISNKDGDSPVDMMWEKDKTGAWGKYSTDWGGTSLDLYISPFMTETPPQANIVVANTNVCVGDTITFDGTTSNNNSDFNWSLPSSNTLTSTDSVVKVVYSTAGTYSAILRVTGGCSGSSSDTVQITVNPVPVVSATATPASVCSNSSVTLSASGATLYNWDHGLGSGNTKIVTPTSTTTYTVSANQNGCTVNKQVTVTVNPTPTIVVASTTSPTACGGNGTINLTFTNVSDGSYTVNYTSGSFSNVSVVGGNATISAPSGTYNNLTISNGSCSSASGVNATINSTSSLPTISVASTTPPAACGGNGTISLTFTNVTDGTYSIGYSTGTFTNVVVSGGNASISAPAGVYSDLTITTGLCTSINGVNASLSDPSAPATPIVSVDTATCSAQGSASIINYSGTPSNYIFSPSGPTISGGNITGANLNTSYSVVAKVGGCSSAGVNFVIQSQLATPNLTVNASNTAVCIGNSAVLTASGADNYSWDNGFSGPSQTVSPNATTSYTVTGTSNTSGCSSQATIQIAVNNPPVVTVTPSQTTICTGASVTISASGATSYSWDNGFTSASQTLTPTSTTTYTVTGTDNGCSTQASVTITVNNTPNLQVNASQNSICLGDNVTLSASGADSYTWTPSSTLNSSTGAVVVATPVVQTTYHVTGSNSCGNSAQDVTISINPSPSTPVISQNGNTLSVSLSAGETANWYEGSVLIGNGDQVTINHTGNYTVVVTNTSGCTIQTSGTFKPELGTSDLTDNHNLYVYPNPTIGTVNISWKGIQDVQSLEVMDLLGQVIFRDNISTQQDQAVVDLSRFEKGVYIIQIITTQRKFNTKINKN